MSRGTLRHGAARDGLPLVQQFHDLGRTTFGASATGLGIPARVPEDCTTDVRLGATTYNPNAVPCTLYYLRLSNNTASAAWFLIVDKASAPAAGAGDIGLVVRAYLVGPAQEIERLLPKPLRIGTGLGACWSSTLPTALITLPGAAATSAELIFR